MEQAVFERMVKIRRDLHRHPELSWDEHRTADRIDAALEELGLRPRRILDTGIVADLPGPPDVPAVALRADIDALPIQEETGLDFASVHEGVMHACGHDGHTAMLLGAAQLLSQERNRPAPIRLIFQPAEETGSGAPSMIEAGALEGVAVIFGGHLDRHYPTGALVVSEGAVNASTDAFEIRVSSQGGHAARPHESVDAVVVGSLIVMAIQTIVSREIDPSHPSVVSIGRFHSGSAGNVIAARAELEGTIRAQDPGVRDHLKRSLRRISESVAVLHQAEITLDLSDGTPGIVNTPEATALARQAALEVAGEDGTLTMDLVNMGGDDFAYYLEHVPGCYIRLGSQVPGREGFPAHSSKFEFDEDALAAGASWMAATALAAGRSLRDSAVRWERELERR